MLQVHLHGACEKQVKMVEQNKELGLMKDKKGWGPRRSKLGRNGYGRVVKERKWNEKELKLWRK